MTRDIAFNLKDFPILTLALPNLLPAERVSFRSLFLTPVHEPVL